MVKLLDAKSKLTAMVDNVLNARRLVAVPALV
jgi:hypothetical protein